LNCNQQDPAAVLLRQYPDPFHTLQGQSFSNAFSNADDYVRSRSDAGELKAQYSNRLRSLASVGELKTTAWRARGQEF
jgi:hypothetical protein